MGFNTYPNNPWPLSSDQAGSGGSAYVLPTASDDTLGGVKVGDGLTITDGVLSSDNPTPYELPAASDETLGGVIVGNGLSIENGVLSAAGGGLQLYHETYTGTGEVLNALNLEHTPVFVLAVQRTDHKVVMSPFAPWTLRAIVYYDVPNPGNSQFTVINNNGALSVQGTDAGASCNTLNEEYEVYYLA